MEKSVHITKPSERHVWRFSYSEVVEILKEHIEEEPPEGKTFLWGLEHDRSSDGKQELALVIDTEEQP